MRVNALAVAFASVAAATAAIAQPERVIASAAAREDVELARRALEKIHPGLYRYTPKEEIDAGFARLEAMCARDVTEREFYAAISVLLAQIRCSHTKAEPSPAWAAWREKAPSYVPFRFVEEDGRMIVVDSAVDSIHPGEEIVRIDGTSTRALMASILDAVPADGWTDGARRFYLSSASDLDESEFDHFMPAFMEMGERVMLEVRGPGAGASRVERVELLTKEARRAGLSTPAPANNLDEAVSLDIRGDVAILRVGTFVAYRKPIPPEEIYRPLFEKVREANVSTLILDLRDNGGGSDNAAIDLARFLVDAPFELKTKAWVRAYDFGDLADRLETWDRSALHMPAEAFDDLGNGYYQLKSEDADAFTPLSPTFTGRLIALCGPANASGSTLFLAGLRDTREVTLVGEPTGGSAEGPTAGVMFFLPLPNSGINVRIPAIRAVTGLKGANPAGGVDPDVLVVTTAADRAAGRDPVLERALEIAANRTP